MIKAAAIAKEHALSHPVIIFSNKRKEM